jgi:two-component sensor histidine kinase
MRPQDKSGNQQMNLTLIDQRAVNLPDERERELALALLELLLNAAAEPAEPQPSDPLQNGGHDES